MHACSPLPMYGMHCVQIGPTAGAGQLKKPTSTYKIRQAGNSIHNSSRFFPAWLAMKPGFNRGARQDPHMAHLKP